MTQPADPSRLAPPDNLYLYQSPPRVSRERHRQGRERALSPLGFGDAATATAVNGTSRMSADNGGRRREGRRRDRRRGKPKGVWRKLLWLRQSYPDNYTDASTFLDHLERNPRLQPYQFWRLIADSTVIVQHVCSVAIFVCCFSGIFQERLSPVTIVGWGSAGTVTGWILWDFWIGQEEEVKKKAEEEEVEVPDVLSVGDQMLSDDFHPPPSQLQVDPLSTLSPRTQQRVGTVKSAVLIYCAVLGLSPILKSLTKSTTSDSIWAMSCWLMAINVFFFDYSGGVEAKFPASLSTNAALMASTVLASRLTSTTHVFSLTLFSIQVFGLFPVFRRHLLHISRRLHNLLTLALVLAAGGGVALTVGSGGWRSAVLGCILGVFTAALAMGGASWWLIGLQKWKDEIVGPWDAARPRLRRRWD